MSANVTHVRRDFDTIMLKFSTFAASSVAQITFELLSDHDGPDLMERNQCTFGLSGEEENFRRLSNSPARRVV